MRKLIALLILVIVSFTLYSQERINGTQYKFSSTTQTVQNIVYWTYSEFSERWTSQKSINSDGHSKNLRSICIKTANIEDNIYYVFVLSYKTGHYIYPAIYEDWITEIENRYCLIEKDSLDILVNLDEELSIITANHYAAWSPGEGDKEDNIIRNLILGRGSTYPGKTYIIFKKYKDVVRLDYNFRTTNPEGVSNLSSSYFEIPYSEWKKLSVLK